MLSNKRGSQPAKPLGTSTSERYRLAGKIEWRIYFLTGRAFRLSPRIIRVRTKYFDVYHRRERASNRRRADAKRGYGSPYRKGERVQSDLSPRGEVTMP